MKSYEVLQTGLPLQDMRAFLQKTWLLELLACKGVQRVCWSKTNHISDCIQFWCLEILRSIGHFGRVAMPAHKYLFLIWVIYVPYTYRFENSIAIIHRRMQMGSPEMKYKSVPTFHIWTCQNIKQPMRHSTTCYIEINDTHWKWIHVNRLTNENNANVRLIYLSNINTIISWLTRPVAIYMKNKYYEQL